MTSPCRSPGWRAFGKLGILSLAAGAFYILPGFASAADAGLPLIDFGAAGADARIRHNPGNEDAEFRIVDGPKGKALEVEVKAGGTSGYPGVLILPKDGAWDLSAYGCVEASVTNLGEKAATICLRVDNDGDWQSNPWSSENLSVQPGRTGTGKVYFGYSWGKPGFKLDPSKVSQILVFIGKPKETVKFRVESLCASGKPGSRPGSIVDSVKPKDGSIFNFSSPSASSLIEERGAKAVLSGKAAQIAFSSKDGEKWPGVFFKAPEGTVWNLGDFDGVEFSVSNPGAKPVRIFCRVDNKGANGRANCAVADATLAPGERKSVPVRFASAKPWSGNEKDSGSRISSADVVGALIFTEKPSEDCAIALDSINAFAGIDSAISEWLGKRPPVEGDWSMTFNDDFDGGSLDLKKWCNEGPNYWDKKTHWSKANAIVGGGTVRLRYEKRHGFHNDNPDDKTTSFNGKNESDYACGFLETYGKWTQRYGYFEARMKLPGAPGLWPAFWMMPDRGSEAGPQWKRQETGKGGMEFDIMEHLTRWGSRRYNIAFHWNGYGKNHKSIGSESVYVQPDKDGFITCGLLWTPGFAAYYCNGREVARWEDPVIASVQSNMIFTMPMGGWNNNALDDSKLPADFIIDYVRVWQRKDLASPEDGFKPQPPAKEAAPAQP